MIHHVAPIERSNERVSVKRKRRVAQAAYLRAAHRARTWVACGVVHDDHLGVSFLASIDLNFWHPLVHENVSTWVRIARGVARLQATRCMRLSMAFVAMVGKLMCKLFDCFQAPSRYSLCATALACALPVCAYEFTVHSIRGQLGACEGRRLVPTIRRSYALVVIVTLGGTAQVGRKRRRRCRWLRWTTGWRRE